MGERVNYGEIAKKFASETAGEQYRKQREAKKEQSNRELAVRAIHKHICELLQDFDGIELSDGCHLTTSPGRDMLIYCLPAGTPRISAVFTTEWKQQGSYSKKDPKQWYKCIAEFRYPYEHRMVGRTPEEIMEQVAKHIGSLM